MKQCMRNINLIIRRQALRLSLHVPPELRMIEDQSLRFTATMIVTREKAVKSKEEEDHREAILQKAQGGKDQEVDQESTRTDNQEVFPDQQVQNIIHVRDPHHAQEVQCPPRREEVTKATKLPSKKFLKRRYRFNKQIWKFLDQNFQLR